MKIDVGDTEDDSAEIEELLAELDEDESTSRYYNLHSSNDSHAKTQLDSSIMHTQESKRPPLSDTHDNVERKASDAPHAHLHLDRLRTDSSNNTMGVTPPTSPLKSSHAHHCEMRVFAVDTPPSPPSSPPSPPPRGCSCFLLPSNRKVKKQKKHSEVEQRSSKTKAKIQQGKACDDSDYDDGDRDNDEWVSVLNETGPQQMDARGLFDVKNTEKEFKRVSMKEKQLTKEAQEFLKMVAST